MPRIPAVAQALQIDSPGCIPDFRLDKTCDEENYGNTAMITKLGGTNDTPCDSPALTFLRPSSCRAQGPGEPHFVAPGQHRLLLRRLPLRVS